MSSFCCQNKATNITTTSLTMRYNFAHPRKNFENNFENNFISSLLIAIAQPGFQQKLVGMKQVCIWALYSFSFNDFLLTADLYYIISLKIQPF